MHSASRLLNVSYDSAVAVVCSGGLDSSVLLCILRDYGVPVIPLAFDDGTKVFRERDFPALSNFCVAHDFEPVVLRTANPDQARDGNFLIGWKFNLLLTALSFCYAQEIRNLAFGNTLENELQPYIDQKLPIAKRLADLFNDVYAQDNRRVAVSHPISHRNKVDLIQYACSRSIRLDLTLSCSSETETSTYARCWKCEDCGVRADAFAKARIADPEPTDPLVEISKLQREL